MRVSEVVEIDVDIGHGWSRNGFSARDASLDDVGFDPMRLGVVFEHHGVRADPIAHLPREDHDRLKLRGFGRGSFACDEDQQDEEVAHGFRYGFSYFLIHVSINCHKKKTRYDLKKR